MTKQRIVSALRPRNGGRHHLSNSLKRAAMWDCFDILGLPANFRLNESALETAYFAAQRAVHPDRLIGKDEADRAVAIQRSERVNDAYETLKNPVTRSEHLLALKSVNVKEINSQAVLMEMMEFRERLESMGRDGRALLSITEEIKKAAQGSTEEIARAFDAENYEKAAVETVRLGYLMKAIEEAYTLLYRLKSEARGA